MTKRAGCARATGGVCQPDDRQTTADVGEAPPTHAEGSRQGARGSDGCSHQERSWPDPNPTGTDLLAGTDLPMAAELSQPSTARVLLLASA